MRLGWMLPGRYAEQITYQKFLDNISTAIHPQLAMSEFLAKGSFRRCVRQAARVYKRRMERLRYWVSEYFPEGTRLSNPDGGFVLWMELAKQVDSFELYQSVLARKLL